VGDGAFNNGPTVVMVVVVGVEKSFFKIPFLFYFQFNKFYKKLFDC